MNIMILGAAGFIGTNLSLELAKNINNVLTLVDVNKDYFLEELSQMQNVSIIETPLNSSTKFDYLLKGQDIVYHLVSTTIPGSSNRDIGQELQANIDFSVNLFESCIKCGIQRIIFISSGGTVYGKDKLCPLNENMVTDPITTYGIQKLMIEKLLYLYSFLYGLDYRIIRLSNPYGPYQRPNGMLGAVTTFTYKALKHKKITVYGDGSVIRDYIYIDDAIKAILKISKGESKYRIFNLGCGKGTSITELLDIISGVLNIELDIEYRASRSVDVPENYLDISRYEECYGILNPVDLSYGIIKTAEFIKKYY